MTPSRLTGDLIRDAPVLTTTDSIAHGVRALLDSELPALPVVDPAGRLAGIFGEREFLQALFPRYLDELSSARFVPRSLDVALERSTCQNDPVGDHLNAERIDVRREYSDVEIAETFLHHRVLIVPVVDQGRVVGVVTRADVFNRLADELLTRDRP